MNQVCWQFNRDCAVRLGQPKRVVEIGALDVNGNVRELWPGAEYIGLDLLPGPNVDVVGDGATWQPDEPVDLVVCNGVLEHTDHKQAIIDNAYKMLREGGALILVVAGPDFPPHGILGASVEGEYYVAMTAEQVRLGLSAFAGVEVGTGDRMILALARKGEKLPDDNRLKMLLVHPGANWSTQDVWRGYTDAFERAGVRLVHYALDRRIAAWTNYLNYLYRQRKRKGDAKPPQPVEAIYQAGAEITTRALQHEVEWVFIITGTFILPESFRLMRRAGLKVATMLTESPYDEGLERLMAQMSDVVFTNERTCVEKFRTLAPTYYLPHSYDPARHNLRPTLANDALSHDVVFVGTGFEERLDLLAAVDWDGIDLGLYGTYDLWGSRNKMRRFIRAGNIANDLTAALYRKAKIGLNLHRTSVGYGRNVKHVTGAESMNPRCYELAATGTFFITDARAEVAEVFGDVAPTFSTPQELGDKIRHYLARDSERIAAGLRLPRLVRGCAFDDRVKIVLEALHERSD